MNWKNRMLPMGPVAQVLYEHDSTPAPFCTLHAQSQKELASLIKPESAFPIAHQETCFPKHHHTSWTLYMDVSYTRYDNH